MTTWGSMDADIDRLIRSHDHKAALHALVDAYGGPLGRFCQGLLGSPQDAADALQDTLVAALSAMPAYRGDAGVRAWIYTIARRTCADVIRKRGRRRTIFARVFGRGDVSIGPMTSNEAVDARVSLEGALRTLPEHQREAVLLRYQQGLDATEVADVLGISHAAARKRISIGMQALRAYLDRQPNPAPVNPNSQTGSNPTDEARHDFDPDQHSLRAAESSPRLQP